MVSFCDVCTIHFSQTVSQNWRAVAAMVVSVPPTFPGLIYSIRGSAHVGALLHLFDVAFMLGVSIELFEDLTCA